METYNGHVRTPQDAIILFEATRLGLLPRVQRRLSEKERQSIKSGSVFVWDEREAGMRRWTDGKSWSASRVSGSFLTYREMEGKRGGNGFATPGAATRAGKTPDSTRGSDSDLETAGDDGAHDGYRYKPDGLMKQSFSITTSNGNHLHLISYYARSHPNAAGLCNPSTDSVLRGIRPQKGMYPESTAHEQQSIPATTRAPMAGTPYSAVPQMAGYARSGAPQHPMYPPHGYGWPPQSPVHNGQMQNGNGNGYQSYDYQYGPPGPPPPNGYSPLSHAQSANPTSQPQQSHSPHPRTYGRSPVPHYDRSPGPNESQPPPPPHPSNHHRVSSAGSGNQQYQPHPYDRPQYPGSYAQQPQPQHAPQGYEQQHQHPHYSQHPYPSYPNQDHSQYQEPHQPYPPPQHYHHTPPASQQNLPTRTHSHVHAASTPIDPRLMAPTTYTLQHPTRPEPSRTPSPHPSQQVETAPDPNTQLQTNGTTPSQASTMPSIGSLMNGPPPPPALSSNTQQLQTPTEARSDRPRTREREKSRSKSPVGGKNIPEGARDTVLRERAGPNEDTRQLHMLDRAFKT